MWSHPQGVSSKCHLGSLQWLTGYTRKPLRLRRSLAVITMPKLSDGSLQGARALVVEDHRSVADALASVLTDAGIEVVGPVATQIEAEQLALAQRPDLALVDLNLGREEAVDLIPWLLERRLGVIVMSGLAMLPKELGQDIPFLQKPFSGEELLAAMHQGLLAAPRRIQSRPRRLPAPTSPR
jgi:DNA-binding NtrC family response regulator